LKAKGQLRDVQNDRTQTEMKLRVTGASWTCKLHGTLAAPRGHYMVLGTAEFLDRLIAGAQETSRRSNRRLDGIE